MKKNRLNISYIRAHDATTWRVNWKAATDDEKDARIKAMKESLPAQEICDGFLPREFVTYINYTQGLAFDDKPDYLYLRRLFDRRFRAEGFTYDHVFD
ncbi:hypothetical protein P885DRAFT_79028 [Corynascus similis CBS 632.67]